MRITWRHVLIVLCLLSQLAVGTLPSSCVWAQQTLEQDASGNSAAAPMPIKFKPILSGDYDNFPVNWPAEQVYRFSLMRSAAEYDQVFQAAAVGGAQKPYAPDPKIYEKEMIVSVSRVTPAPADLDKALRIDKIVAKGKTLEVYFTFRAGPKSASYTAKVTGAARIPKRELQKVIFFEGQKKVGEIKVE